MSEPLATLFDLFVRERIYLKAVTAKTLAWYRTGWAAFVAHAGPVDATLTKANVKAMVIALRDKGLSARSVNSYLQCVNAFARWLHEEHGHPIVRQPLLKVPSRVIRTFGDAELRALLAFTPQTRAEWRTATLVATLIDTGCRINELLELRWIDVDMDQLTVTVRGKGDRDRRIPFSAELRKRLHRYRKLTRDCALVFGSRCGTAWSQRNALRAYYLLKATLGLPHQGGFHQLRHTFATQYLREGGSVVRLSKQLGHRHITTTMQYEHLVTADLSAAHERLSPLSRLRLK